MHINKALAWAFYDWANSAFATTVMAGFFPVFFKQYWSAGNDATASTWHLGIANSAASLLVMILSPVLGAIADKGSAKKRFLLLFTVLGVLGVALLPMIGQGQWVLAAWCYSLATLGFAGGLTFYDALIVAVAEPREFHRVSALGYALGYLGGGLLFAVNVAMVVKPGFFAIPDATTAIKIAFISVAVWWAVFSLPLFMRVDEPRNARPLSGWNAIRAGLVELRASIRELRESRPVVLFLAAYFLYIDGVDTVVRMAIDYGMALGFDSNSLIIALLVTQFVGFPAAIIFGQIGDHLGPKAGILIAILIYIAVLIYAFYMQRVAEFYVLAVAIGLVQGGVQSLSRSLYAGLIPKQKSAEYFGLYNMWGKFSAVLGPILVGWVSVATNSPRFSILSIAVLFIAGAILLYRVDDKEGHANS